MRVDTSLLDGINAANAAKSSSSLKSTGTSSSFSSALKSASEKETTKPVPGTNYHEILTGPRAGMYLNKSGNARDGEAFVLVKHDGREDHIYGTGKNRKVISSGTDKTSTKDADSSEKTSSSSSTGAREGERTEQVPGRAYHDILNGSRSGMYLNTSGNVRDGQAFVLVKRDDREYHIYGSGSKRTVVSVKIPTETPATETPATSDTTDAAAKTGSSLVDQVS
ncbi:MAG TPA: hypothetical protein VFZ00_22910 [Solirubrobacter sp.]|nr:hypothetical protein [Solirubrobacter sp.]